MGSIVVRNAVLASLIAAAMGCAHAAAKPTCAPPSPHVHSELPATTPAWLDRESLDATEPLSLFDIQWVLKTSDETEVIAPAALHAFTLGRWECALSEERSADALTAERLIIARERRLVCTHASGLTAQTQLSCGYEAPSRAALGAPSTSGRQTEIALADAPTLTWSCRPTEVERLVMRDRAGSAQAICVSEGRAPFVCDAAANLSEAAGDAQPSLLSP